MVDTLKLSLHCSYNSYITRFTLFSYCPYLILVSYVVHIYCCSLHFNLALLHFTTTDAYLLSTLPRHTEPQGQSLPCHCKCLIHDILLDPCFNIFSVFLLLIFVMWIFFIFCLLICVVLKYHLSYCYKLL